jgi:hypothetical protein
MAIATNGLQIVRIAGAVFNQQLSAADYSEILTANKTAAELNAWANSAVAAEFKGKTTTDISKAVLANLGLTVTGLDAWLAGQLTAGGGVAKAGETMLGLLNDYSNMTADVTFGASATTFNTKAAASQALSLTAGTATGTYAAVNSTAVNAALTLTAAVNTLTGTAGDDTFTGATGTLNAGDTVNGGAGTDTLNVTISGTAPTQSATSLVSVEVLNLTSSPNAASIDLTGVTGLTSVNSLNSANIPVTASNIGNVVNSTITGSSSATNVGYTTAAVVGLTDAATLTLSGTSTGATFVTSGVETLTVNSSGTAANTLDTLTDTGITGLVITGSQGLTITNAVGGATITSVNASAATGAVTVTSGNGPALTGVTVTGPTAGGAFTATTGSGRDTFTITAGASTLTPSTGQDTLNLGSGVDTVRFAEAGIANADTINSFTATDVIAVNLGQAQFTSASGVITLASANASFGTVQSGATTPTISGVNGAGAAATISFQAIAPGTAVTATTNVLALTGTFTDGTAGGAASALGTSANTGITTTAGGKFLLVTYSVGNIAQVWSYAGDTTTSNTDIDSGELSLVATLNGVAANSLTAANFATYLTPATASSSANTTVGNTFTVTAANALVTPLTAVLATPLTSTMTGFNDTVNGANFAGVFVQDLSTTDADVYNTLVNVALAPSLVNVETVNATMAGSTLTTTGFTGVNTISVSGGAGTITTGAATMPTIALSSGYASTLTATPAAAGNAVAIRLDGSATGAAISSSSTALTINVASASSLSGGVTSGAAAITVTGAGALTLGAITTGTSIAGTAMTGALTQTAIGSLTVNSGSGADVLTLVTGTSVLNTGAGNDTFSAVGGIITSADTLNGGAGTDTISITGNVAVAATDFNGAVSIEAITYANTSANVAITTVNALVDAGATLTVSGSALTGTLTFNGALETNGFFNITGGAGIDTITGGANADTITTGLAADVITGGGGNDTINLAESTAAADKVVFSGAGAEGAVAAQFAANGTDTINGWSSGDLINVVALGDGTTAAASTAITAASTRAAMTDDNSIVISTTGAAANLTTSGTAVVTDFTNGTQVAAYLSERFTATDNTFTQVFVINNTASGANQTFIYTFKENGTATSIVDIELALVGVIYNNGVALVDANVVYS